MGPPIEQSQTEIKAEELLHHEHHFKRRRRDVFLITALATLIGAIAFLLLAFSYRGQLTSTKHDLAKAQMETDCRTNVAQRLRDADSSVISANALLREKESGIEQAIAGILEKIVVSPPGVRVDYAQELALLQTARKEVPEATTVLDQALDAQTAARQANDNINAICNPKS